MLFCTDSNVKRVIVGNIYVLAFLYLLSFKPLTFTCNIESYMFNHIQLQNIFFTRFLYPCIPMTVSEFPSGLLHLFPSTIFLLIVPLFSCPMISIKIVCLGGHDSMSSNSPGIRAT